MRALFSIFKKVQQSPLPLTPYSYEPQTFSIIALLTIFAMGKLKINLFSVSMVTLCWKLSVACFAEHSLHRPP